MDMFIQISAMQHMQKTGFDAFRRWTKPMIHIQNSRKARQVLLFFVKGLLVYNVIIMYNVERNINSPHSLAEIVSSCPIIKTTRTPMKKLKPNVQRFITYEKPLNIEPKMGIDMKSRQSPRKIFNCENTPFFRKNNKNNNTSGMHPQLSAVL